MERLHVDEAARQAAQEGLPEQPWPVRMGMVAAWVEEAWLAASQTKALVDVLEAWLAVAEGLG